MTKLKQPIVVTIETAEEAFNVYHRFNFAAQLIRDGAHPATRQCVVCNIEPGSTWQQLKGGMAANGLDPSQSLPQPLLVGTHEVKANPDGSIRVGCTTVDRQTLEAVLKLSSEAMVGDWPKWFKTGCNQIIRFDNKSDFGLWHNGDGKTTRSEIYHADNIVDFTQAKPLTPQQAREILSSNSKDQPK